eukprot:1526305-Rhodomonas_salina.1
MEHRKHMQQREQAAKEAKREAEKMKASLAEQQREQKEKLQALQDMQFDNNRLQVFSLPSFLPGCLLDAGLPGLHSRVLCRFRAHDWAVAARASVLATSCRCSARSCPCRQPHSDSTQSVPQQRRVLCSPNMGRGSLVLLGRCVQLFVGVYMWVSPAVSSCLQLSVGVCTCVVVTRWTLL